MEIVAVMLEMKQITLHKFYRSIHVLAYTEHF
jgi:hypothetical protein